MPLPIWEISDGFFFLIQYFNNLNIFILFYFFPFARTKPAPCDPGLWSEPRLKLTTAPPEGEAEVSQRKGCTHLSSDLDQEEDSIPYKQEVVKFYLS